MIDFAAAGNLDPFFDAHGQEITVNGATVEALVDLGYSLDPRNPDRRQKNVDRSFTIRTSDRGSIAKGNIVVHDSVQYQVLTPPVDDGMGLTAFQVQLARTP